MILKLTSIIEEFTYAIYLRFLIHCNPNDEKISCTQYFLRTGKKLNINNPRTFVEKTQWLKLFYYDETYGKYVDKLLSREFVKNRVGAHLLVNLISTVNHVDDIDFDQLPSKFALKCSHGSGFNLIVNDL